MKKRTITAIVALALMVLIIAVSNANAAKVTWYGPGFYGGPYACGHHRLVPTYYQYRDRGAAHPSWPCGSKVKVVCRDFSLCKRRWIVVRVIDRCRCTLDLTQRSMADMTGGRHYTINARYSRVSHGIPLRPSIPVRPVR